MESQGIQILILKKKCSRTKRKIIVLESNFRKQWDYMHSLSFISRKVNFYRYKFAWVSNNKYNDNLSSVNELGNLIQWGIKHALSRLYKIKFRAKSGKTQRIILSFWVFLGFVIKNANFVLEFEKINWLGFFNSQSYHCTHQSTEQYTSHSMRKFQNQSWSW